MYSKAGKSAFKIGKELLADTTKVVVSNQKTVRETSAKAFKETVDTIKESHIIENPLKGILKNKKTKNNVKIDRRNKPIYSKLFCG